VPIHKYYGQGGSSVSSMISDFILSSSGFHSVTKYSSRAVTMWAIVWSSASRGHTSSTRRSSIPDLEAGLEYSDFRAPMKW
jgi:hypothetical protein